LELFSIAKLTFLDKPDKEVAQKQGETLMINCTAEGPANIEVMWFKVLTVYDISSYT